MVTSHRRRLPRALAGHAAHAVGDDRRPRPGRLPGGRPAPDLQHHHQVPGAGEPRADRIAEAFRTAIRVAYAEHGPVQVDVPRDFFYGEVDVRRSSSPSSIASRRAAPATKTSLDRAAEVLRRRARTRHHRRPGRDRQRRRRRGAPARAPARRARRHHLPAHRRVPGHDELAVGPIGYQGSKAAMRLLSEARRHPRASARA